MHVRENNKYKASDTNGYTNELLDSILGLEKEPGEKQDTWYCPTIQQHHARD